MLCKRHQKLSKRKWLCFVSALHILFQGLLEAAAGARRVVVGTGRGWRAGRSGVEQSWEGGEQQ